MAIDWRLCSLFCFLATLWTAQSAAMQVTTGRVPTTIVSVNSGDGKVEVFHDGLWSYICANGWDNEDARVVCRMQGYWQGQGQADLRPLHPGDVVLLDNMACNGSETEMDQCRFNGWQQQSCGIGAVGAVSCNSTGSFQVRLEDGFGPWEGRLEVLSEGLWRPVCSTGFDDQDAQVVCRMLGIRTEGGKAHAEHKFSQSNHPPLIRKLDCTGLESDIGQCKGQEATGADHCDSVGVECYNCGGLYSTANGTLQSENYPHSYPRNLDCLFVIRPANRQQLYKLHFVNFSTEACCDTLQVSVEQDNTLIKGRTYSGSQFPPLLLGQAFALHFMSDGSRAMPGFRAHWSPARVEDVVTVRCGTGNMSVDIDLDFLKRMYPQSNETNIALADPGCVGKVLTDRRGGRRLIIQWQPDTCDARIESGNTDIVYNNFVVERVFAEGNSMIVRQRLWEIAIHCQLPSTDDLLVRYNPFADAKRRVAEVQTAHVRRAREVHGSVTVETDFPITFTAFQDMSYTRIDTLPLARHLGDDVFLRVEMRGGDLDLKMVLQNCYTTAGPGSNMTYFIIRHGCAVDATTHIVNIQPHKTDFKFKAFEFAGDFPRVYVTCDVRVCLASEKTPECQQQCGGGSPSAGPIVGKRAAFDRIIHRLADTSQNQVEFGPLVLET